MSENGMYKEKAQFMKKMIIFGHFYLSASFHDRTRMPEVEKMVAIYQKSDSWYSKTVYIKKKTQFMKKKVDF